MFDSLWNLVTFDIGIDLGTANIRVGLQQQGVVIHEPSVVAINKVTKEVLAVGKEAREMLGRTPATVVAVRPLQDGVITDFEITLTMMRYFIRKVHALYGKSFKIPRPRVVVGVPSAITEVEKQAVVDAAKAAGARDAFVVEEPMAAAIGVGLPVNEAIGNMIVDIGGGTTDVAIISMGGIVIDKTIKVAGDEMDEEIVNYVREKYNLLIGRRTAEDIKMAIASAFPLKKERTVMVQGRDMVRGLPKAVELSSIELREALAKPVQAITEAVKEALEDCPPELVADIYRNGIYLTGGGSKLQGIDEYLQDVIKVPVKRAENPGISVALGTLKILSEVDLLKRLKNTEDMVI